MSVEIKPQWENIVKRMQSMARKYDGTVIIQLTVAANGDGVPLLWTKPKVIPLEPRLSVDLKSLEKTLGKDEMRVLLNWIMTNV